ncbi:MAG: hypothetical protein ACON5N_05500 [Akkermansiaceae bacterium]
MISIKHLSSLIAVGFLFVSCAPVPPGGSQPPVDPNNVPVAPAVLTPEQEAEAKAAAERMRIREQKRREAAEAAKNGETGTADNPTTTGEGANTPPAPTGNGSKPKYRTAVVIPGKPGFVYNPWTNKAVDVRGIPSGEAVRDPHDPNKNHIFRVP